MKKHFKKAFTVAELITVVVVLGLIAVLTSVIITQRVKQTENKTKLKKAMAVYENVLHRIIIENALHSNEELTAFAQNPEGCVNTRKYFKIAQETDNGCVFSTVDGVWWHIFDIQNPVISLDKNGFGLPKTAMLGNAGVAYAADETSSINMDDLKTKAKDPNNNTIFIFVGHFDEQGILRVNDINVETGDNLAYLKKINNFIGTPKHGIDSAIKRKEPKTPYISCYGTNICYKYDEYGNQIFEGQICKEGTLESCYNKAYWAYTYDENGNVMSRGNRCKSNEMSSCEEIQHNFYDSNGNIIAEGCNEEKTKCSATYSYDGSRVDMRYFCNGIDSSQCTGAHEIYIYDENGDKTIDATRCKSNDISSCSSTYLTNYYDGENKWVGWDCKSSANNASCSYYLLYNKDGKKLAGGCKGRDINNCTEFYNYDEKGTLIKENYNCSGDITTCKSPIELIVTYEE